MQIFNKAKFVGGKFTGPLQLVQQGWGISKESIKKGVPVLGGLGGLALALGHTALAGFVTGAVAGGTAGAIGGAILGAKVGAAVGTLVGGPVGAVVGGIVGGITGFIAGGLGGAIVGGTAGMGIALSGEQILKGAGNFVTGAASGLWNGVTTLAGNVLSGAGSFFGGVIGTLGSATVPTAAIGIPVATALTLTISLTIINNINTSTAFLDLEGEKGVDIPGDTQYFTITKTVDSTHLQNADLPRDLVFTITLTAKDTAIGSISLSDKMTVQKESGSFEVTQDKNGTPLSPPCKDSAPSNLAPKTSWSCQFVVTADAKYTDSVATNRITANAIPEGQSYTFTGTSSAAVIIGTPPIPNCESGSSFEQLLPSPIPPSVNSNASIFFPRLDSGNVILAAKNAAQATGVACEVLVGIHFIEASWNDNGSFISGRAIGSPEPDVKNADACNAYGGKMESGGCVFSNLEQTALYAGNHVKNKMSLLVKEHRPPANFEEMIGAMSYYNGGGNANCGEPVNYTGPCPPPKGIDDPYAVNRFDSQHTNMYLIYCSDLTRCNPPFKFERDGSATAAKEFYLRNKGS